MNTDIGVDELKRLFGTLGIDSAADRCRQLLAGVKSCLNNWQGLRHDLELLSECFFDLERYEESIAILKVLIDSDIHLASDDIDTKARHFNDIGVVYSRIGRLVESEASYWTGLGLESQSPSREHTYEGILLVNLAVVLEKRSAFHDAERALSKAARHHLRNGRGSRPEFADVLFYFGRLYFKIGKYQAARKAVERGLRIYRDIAQTNSLGYGRLLSGLGNIDAQMGDIAKAMETYAQALQVFRVIPGASRFVERVEGKLQTLQSRHL